MINPFEREMFGASFNIEGFRESKVILSMTASKGTILKQYLLLKTFDKEEYIVVGFDFVKGKIIPIEKRDCKYIVNALKEFMMSKYNVEKIHINDIEGIVNYFSKLEIRKNDFYRYSDLIVLASPQRNIISSNCVIYSSGVSYIPDESLIIHNKKGFLYGEVVFTSVKKEKFREIHLTEDLILKYSIEPDIVIETGSTIYELRPLGPNSFKFILSNFVYELSNMNIQHTSNSLNPHSAFFEVLRKSGMGKKQINIEGYKATKAPYLVIIPIKNLKVETEELGIADITFLSEEECFNRFEGFQELYKKDLEKSYTSFAYAIVESDNTYDAYLMGWEKIEYALNIIIHSTRNERVFNFYNLAKNINSWDKSQLHQLPKQSTLYYVENIIGFERVFSNSESVRTDTSLTIGSFFKETIEELQWYENILYKKIKGNESKVEKQLFNALKWLNRSWHSKNVEDKVIYTSIALEFLVDEVKTEPYIPPEIKSEFKGLLKKLLKENTIFNAEVASKIREKSLQGLGDPPLKIKVKTLIKDIGIPVTDEEFDRFWNVRSYRNDMVHGRSELQIDEENVTLANILIGELIAYRLKHIKDGEGKLIL
ncbi:hypothetical protein M8R20_20125 [Pseudomonas sp. R2.Fl]|nr:hypothetical protein [Pseudomonas sp. R2.Fl]